MRRALVVGVLVGFAGPGAAAPLPAEWALPKADGEKWVARLRKLARDGWSVTLSGNEITVSRDKPVALVRVVPNMAPNQKPFPDGEATPRFVLRFAPKLSADEYDRLAAVNAASGTEADRLYGAVRDIPHKFDDFIAETADERERVRAYREAVAKLPHHTLPDFYTPDHSVYLVSAGDGLSFSYPADKDVLAEVGDVGDTLMRYFGMYDPKRYCRADYARLPRR